MRRCALCVSACGFFLLLVGCGSGNNVSGTVKYKGKNLTMGTITFVSASDAKKKEFTAIGADGKYRIAEPPQGPVKVAIEVKAPPKSSTTASKDVPVLSTGNLEPVAIPGQYSDPNKSGLTFEIRGGANTYDIDLK